MDFGEAGEDRSVVLIDIGYGGLKAEPQVIPLHPTELFELDWLPGDSIEEKAATVPPGSICKLTIHLDRGMGPQTIQAAARTLIGPGLLWPPEIRWASHEAGGEVGSPTPENVDWRQRVRDWVRSQVAEDDPLRSAIAAAVEELIAEEAEVTAG